MDKQIKLMRYWLFGTFCIFFAAILATVGQFQVWSQAVMTSLPAILVVAVLCVGAYFLYLWYLKRQK